MCFDPEIYARFMDKLAKAGIFVPILPGTRILKSRTQAQKMAQKFRVTVPGLAQGSSEVGRCRFRQTRGRTFQSFH